MKIHEGYNVLSMITLSEYYERLEAASRSFNTIELGRVDNCPILFLTPKKIPTKLVLIAGGFHGEEPAGPLGILHYIESHPSCSLSFLPLVNPTGFRVNRRYNLMGQNPNSGFCHDYGNSPSIERDMLLRHFNMIINASRDAFVSLHEDIDEDRFYVYSFENSVTTGKFTKSLVSILSSFFNQFQMA